MFGVVPVRLSQRVYARLSHSLISTAGDQRLRSTNAPLHPSPAISTSVTQSKQMTLETGPRQPAHFQTHRLSQLPSFTAAYSNTPRLLAKIYKGLRKERRRDKACLTGFWESQARRRDATVRGESTLITLAQHQPFLSSKPLNSISL